jgi:hypothetical protein
LNFNYQFLNQEFLSFKKEIATIPEIISGKIEFFSEHQRFLIATESSKYVLIFVLNVCVILCEIGTAKYINLKDMLGFVVYLK